MKKYLAASAAGRRAVRGIASRPPRITVDSARAILAPFYKALNAEFVKDAARTVRQSTDAGLEDLPGQRSLQYAAMRSWPGSDSGSKRFPT